MGILLGRRTFVAALGASLLPVRANAAATISIKTADGRLSQISRWQPKGRTRGTILFSHGFASAPWKYEALLRPWADAGYDIWAPLHVDSTDHPDTKNYPGLRNWGPRIEDMRALAAHVGAQRYVAAGHSYGALVALTLGGVLPSRPDGVTGPLSDPAVSSVVAFSPPAPGLGPIDAAGYATLARPALIQTGTLDHFPVSPPESWRTHLTAYDAAAPGGDRYALVLDGVDHYFGGGICRPELPGPVQAAQLAAAANVAVQFMRVYAEGQHRTKLDNLLTQTGPVQLSRK